MEGDDGELGQEHGEEGVGLLLLTVCQGLGHCIPGVKAGLQGGPGLGGTGLTDVTLVTGKYLGGL